METLLFMAIMFSLFLSIRTTRVLVSLIDPFNPSWQTIRTMCSHSPCTKAETMKIFGHMDRCHPNIHDEQNDTIT